MEFGELMMRTRVLRRFAAIILAITVVNGSLAHAAMFTEVGARSPAVAQAKSHEIHRPAMCLSKDLGSHCALCALSTYDGVAILADTPVLIDGATPETCGEYVIALSSARLTHGPPIRAPPLNF